METAKESVLKKPSRPKSAARYPKRMNTFVVAFAVQDSHDNKSKKTAETKRSNENSLPINEPLSPTGSNTSTKTFTITAAEDISLPITIASVSEVKIDMMSDKNTSEQCCETEKKSSQIVNNLVDEKNIDEQLLVTASRNIKKTNGRKRLSGKFVVKKDIPNREFSFLKHFKYKTSKNILTRNWDKNYVKAKMKSPTTRQIRHIYCNNISTIYSKPKIRNTVNLLNVVGQASLTNFYRFNENDNGSLNSLASTTKRLSSYSSQNTLMNNSFSTVNSDDFYSMKSVNSIVPEPSSLVSYKTDMINVTVAVALSPSNANNFQTKLASKDEEFNNNLDITSKHTISYTGMELTSQAPSEESSKNARNTPNDSKRFNIIDKCLSNETLIDFKHSLDVNSEQDTFKIACTSSEFHKSNVTSDFEIASYSEATLQSEKLQINTCLHSTDTLGVHNNTVGRDTLLDTVIKLGLYPEITPSTSSEPNFDNDFNDVIVTEKNSIKPTVTKNELSRNILSKPFDVENNELTNIHLLDEAVIKSELSNTQKKYSEELKNNALPSNLTEMWDKLTLVLDLALRNLEQTLAAKIVEQLKTSLPKFLQAARNNKSLSDILLTEHKTEEILTEKHELPMLDKEVIVLEHYFRNENDQGLQCDLIHNQVIDQIMLKLSVEGPRVLNSSQISLKSLNKPELKQDCVVLLKPLAVDDVEVGKGDTMSVGTTTSQIFPKTNQRLVYSNLCSRPMTFFRENLLVITSVPTFFLILLCLYGIFSNIARSW